MESTCTCGKKDVYLPEPATVVRNVPMTAQESFFEVTLDSGRKLGHMPGQFVEVSVPGIGEAPISVSSSPGRGPGFEMVVRNIGSVSGAMHRLAPGARVGIRGPFGTTFPVHTKAMKGRDLLFVCGGIGLVPVRAAIQYVFEHRDDYGRVTILFGAKTPAERLFVEETAEWARQRDTVYMETVDRGDAAWAGNVGVITTLLPKVKVDPARTAVVICGPPIMYKFVVIELRRMRLPDSSLYLSLERLMKCGVGKCGHCQINRLYVCQDGPVFSYADISNLTEAL